MDSSSSKAKGKRPVDTEESEEDDIDKNDELENSESGESENVESQNEEDDDVTTTATPTSSGSKRKGSKVKGCRRKRTRSNVWGDFTRTKENYDKCRCNYCHKKYSCATKSGTSNLRKHRLHCKQRIAWKAARVNGQGQQQVLNQDDPSGQCVKVSEEVFREATNEMLIIGEMPLSFVESLAWRHFTSKCQLYKPHSRRTATRDIYQMYVNKKEEMRKILEQNKQRLSLTTDIWTAPTTAASYMVITAHFVDTNWQLKKLIIGFKNISDHKGSTICNVLLECLEEWKIERVFSITVDNATANSSAMRKFKEKFKLLGVDSLVLGGEFMHMRCATHILNLIVKDGLFEVDDSVAAIRNGVHYVRSSTRRIDSFNSKVLVGKKLTRGSLPLDCKTRWNSTYLMLSRALQFKEPFDKMEAEDKLYNDHFQQKVEGKKRIGPPCKADWDAVDRLVQFLVIFYNSTLVLSASTSVSSTRCYKEIVTIENNLKKLSTSSEDEELKKKASAMISKLAKYWNPFGDSEMNKLVIVASVFDPRNKMKFATLSGDLLYGKDSVLAIELHDSIMDILRRLFEEYSIVHSAKTGSSGSGQSSQSQGASQSQEQDQAAGEVMDRMDLGHGVAYESMDFIYNEYVNETGFQDPSTELELYLKEPVLSPNAMRGTDLDILSWWKVNSPKYPVLSEIAKDILAMQVSSVASEAAFSTSGRILDPFRSCLTHYTLEVLMCTEQWLKSQIRFTEKGLITVQQLLAEIEMQDELEKEFGAKLNMD